MADIKVDHDGVSLTSTWTVTENSNGQLVITQGPSTATKTITFAYDLPSNIEVKSAKVHTSWGSPLGGFAIRTVNGVEPDSNGFVDVDITPEDTSTSVELKYKSYGNRNSVGQHRGVAKITEIYLLIEYAQTSCIYRAEGSLLVPYQFYRAENGELVPYQFIGNPGIPEERPAQLLYTAGGEQFYTSGGVIFKVLGD